MQADLSNNTQRPRGAATTLLSTTLLLMALLLMALPIRADAGISLDTVGGSVGVTSDYLVRGISRTQHQASLQADVHAAFGGGFDAGVFAASVEIAPDRGRDAELSGFVGWSRNLSAAWHARIAVDHYTYPWNAAGSKYDYDEFSLDITYQQWLTFGGVYSPNAPRYLPDRGIVNVTAKSAELSAQLPLSRQFFLTGGVGYAHLAGRNSNGYAYWSAGGLYSLDGLNTLGSISISLQYLSTSGAAQQLYYDAAAHNRLAGTVIWRFGGSD